MGSSRPWQGRVCALCCSTGDLNAPHVSLPAVLGGTRPSQPAGKGSERCCLVPSHALMPWGGGSPDAGDTHGESPLLRDWQSGTARCWHLPTLRPLSHPPCAQPPGAAGLHCPGTGLARECHLLLVLALPGDTRQPPTRTAPTGLSPARGTAGAEPARQGSARAPWARLSACQGKLPVPRGNSLFPARELVSLVPSCPSPGENTPAAGSRLRGADPLSAGSPNPP